jgi:hypothetical protein
MKKEAATKKDRDDEDDSEGQKPDSDEDEARDDSAAGLQGVKPRIGESKNNLQQRAEWFQKRSGRE